MVSSTPACKPQIDHTPSIEGPLDQHPVVRATLRGLHVVAGIVMSAVAYLAVGLVAALQGCVGDETSGLCAGSAWLVPVLEWPIFLVAVIAPLAGGIAAFVARRPRWLALGVALAGAMFLLMLVVSAGQTSTLS